jgi:hypothetical protein
VKPSRFNRRCFYVSAPKVAHHCVENVDPAVDPLDKIVAAHIGPPAFSEVLENHVISQCGPVVPFVSRKVGAKTRPIASANCAGAGSVKNVTNFETFPAYNHTRHSIRPILAIFVIDS